MPRTLSRRDFLLGSASASALALLTGCSASSSTVAGAPRQSVWSTYQVGTGTYNDLAAIANTLTGQAGVQVRLMTADTGIGRLAPMINGTAHYARAGDEYYYAFEGDDEFASAQWGPQPMRLVWTPPGNYGVLVRQDSGIETVADLRGRKYPRLVASTSMNRKLEAILNYGGLTPADVNLVDIAYGEQIEGIKTGQLDAMYQNVVGANVEELAAQYPIRWLDLGGNDPSRYETWDELSPMVTPGRFTGGAGMTGDESAVNMRYTLPLTTLADRPAEEVARLVTDLHRYFEHYRDATPDAEKFAVDQIMTSPLVIPFHEGVIDLLKEHGRWDASVQRRQDALLEREQLLAEAWPPFWEQHSGDEDPARAWRDWKREHLPALPTQDPTDGGTA